MGRLIRSMDWSATPLGPAASWPQSLRTTISLCLASNFPINVIWGAQHIQIYNDGYRPICGSKHPRSMGQNFKECWSSAWPAVCDAFEIACAGRSAFLENQRMFLDRNGYLEETFFTFSLSPIRDETGGVGGLFHPVTEMTQKTLAERRLKLLRDLADGAADAKTVQDACALIAQTLAAHPLDLPFVLLYLLTPDGTAARLAALAGLERGTSASRERIHLTAAEQADCWPLAEVVQTGRERQVDDLENRFGSLPCGPYPEPPKSAFVLPIVVPGLEHPLALLVAGVSSRRALDDPYRTFYAMLRESVANVLVSARAYEEERRLEFSRTEADRVQAVYQATDLAALTADASLRASEERFQSFMANSPATAYIKDAEGRYVFVNRLIEQKFKRPLSEWIGRTDLDIFSPEQAEQFRDNDRQVLATRTAAQFVETVAQEDGPHYFLSLKFPLQESDGYWLLAGMSLDITDQKRTESLVGGQKRVLEMIATGQPLAEVLAALVRTIEEQDPGSLCSVLRLNGTGWRVRLAGQRGLPEYCMQGQDGLQIEPPYLSPCAKALHSGLEVIVPDIEADEQWPAQWRALALGHGLRSCRCTPVLASDGRILAAFASYRRQPIDPVRSNNLLVQVATHLTGIAIERQQWLETVRRSEERLRLIVESAKDYAIFTTDLAGRITGWNSGARNLLGYDAAEIAGQHGSIVFTPEDREKGDPERELEKARTQGRAENERWHIRKDGSRFWASGLVMPLKDNDKLLGFLKIMRDMTEQQQNAERLRKAEEQFRTLADNMSQFAWMADDKGWIYWYNRRWYEYTGTTLEQMQGWGWKAVHHPDHVDRVVKRIQHSWDTGELWEDTFPLRGVDGNYRWFLSRAVPIRDERGRILRWFGTNTDITEQRELEQALKDADRKKDEFLATLAHELRNPLAPLRNGLHVMNLSRNDSNATEQARTMMERQLTQMIRLIDDLLDISRISQGKIELRKERIDLATIVHQAIENSRPQIEAGGHDLSVQLPGDRIFVHADMTRMAQVFSNLLNNAAKYTERGGRIALTVQRQERDVFVRVTDSGVGIPAQMLTRVFDTFTQIDRSLERSQGGLGIGLSLVKGIVEMHGGSVEAKSEGHGMGSEFLVRLPLLPSPIEEQRYDKEDERATPTAPRRILVTDDNRDAAISLALILKMLSNDTRTAFDGVEALEVAAAFRPDVILLDIGMPKLNGYEAARRIREQSWGKNVVLIALTGWGQDEDRRRSQEAGFDFHVVKPVEPAALERLLAGVRARMG